MEEKPKVRRKTVRKEKKEETMNGRASWLTAIGVWALVILAFLGAWQFFAWTQGVGIPSPVDQLAGIGQPSGQPITVNEGDVNVDVTCPTAQCPTVCTVCPPQAAPPAIPEVTYITPTVEPEAPVVIPPGEQDHPLGRGEVWDVPKDWTCVGDIRVNVERNSPHNTGEAVYDNLEKTGAVTEFQSPTTIYAPFGADCLRGRHLDSLAKATLAAGCVNGCDLVHKYVWDGNLKLVGTEPSDP